MNERTANSTDERWKYLLYFHKLVTIFKIYQNSMGCGDALGMEYIENIFCGIFYVLDKNKYFEITLSQMERKYHDIDYKLLNEIRTNCSCRYYKDNPDSQEQHKLHVRDEVMENVNMWVKDLPIGNTQESWTTHSPNVTLARKCLLFQKNEYKKTIFDYNKAIEENVFQERHSNNSKYVIPRKTVEKQRIFEFLMLYFEKEHEGRGFNMNLMQSLPDTLTTPLDEQAYEPQVVPESNDKELESIFESFNEIINNTNSNNEQHIINIIYDEDCILGDDATLDNSDNETNFDNQTNFNDTQENDSFGFDINETQESQLTLPNFDPSQNESSTIRSERAHV